VLTHLEISNGGLAVGYALVRFLQLLLGFDRCCVEDHDRSSQRMSSRRRDRKMEPRKFTLCPACTACPEVEITDQGVTIGEEENTVRLSHAEWNELVRLIRAGELREV
jgi:hypothetical protein